MLGGQVAGRVGHVEAPPGAGGAAPGAGSSSCSHAGSLGWRPSAPTSGSSDHSAPASVTRWPPPAAAPRLSATVPVQVLPERATTCSRSPGATGVSATAPQAFSRSGPAPRDNGPRAGDWQGAGASLEAQRRARRRAVQLDQSNGQRVPTMRAGRGTHVRLLGRVLRAGWAQPPCQCRQSPRMHQPGRFVTGHRAGIAPDSCAPAPLAARRAPEREEVPLRRSGAVSGALSAGGGSNRSSCRAVSLAPPLMAAPPGQPPAPRRASAAAISAFAARILEQADCARACE